MVVALVLFVSSWVGLFFPRLFSCFFKSSKPSRIKLFSFLLVGSVLSLALAAPFLPDVEETEENVSHSSNENKVSTKAPELVDNSITYTIISDDRKHNIKRSVEVQINERISAETLERLAKEIKAKDSSDYDRTFIGWRLKDDPKGSMYWATTHYDPNLKVEIQGPTAEQYEYLLKIKPDVKGKVLGSWLETDYGSLSHRLVIYQSNNKTYYKNYMMDGTNGTGEYYVDRDGDGARYRLDVDEPEYFVINGDGSLSYWSEDGRNFRNLKPI